MILTITFKVFRDNTVPLSSCLPKNLSIASKLIGIKFSAMEGGAYIISRPEEQDIIREKRKGENVRKGWNRDKYVM